MFSCRFRDFFFKPYPECFIERRTSRATVVQAIQFKLTVNDTLQWHLAKEIESWNMWHLFAWIYESFVYSNMSRRKNSTFRVTLTVYTVKAFTEMILYVALRRSYGEIYECIGHYENQLCTGWNSCKQSAIFIFTIKANGFKKKWKHLEV